MDIRTVLQEIESVSRELGVQRLKSQASRDELESSRRKLKEAEEHRDRLKAELAALQREAASTEAEANDALKRLERVHKLALLHEEAKLKELVVQREKLEQCIAAIATADLEAEEELDQLNTSIASAQSAIPTLQRKEADSKSQAIELQTKTYALQQELTDCEEKLVDCRAAVEEMEAEEAVKLEQLDAIQSFILQEQEELRKHLATVKLPLDFPDLLVSNMQPNDSRDGSINISSMTSTGEKKKGGRKNSNTTPTKSESDNCGSYNHYQQALVDLITTIDVELLSTQSSMTQLMGRELTDSMMADPEKYLNETRAEVVAVREKVEALVQRDKELQKSLKAERATMNGGTKKKDTLKDEREGNTSDQDRRGNGFDSGNDHSGSGSDGAAEFTCDRNTTRQKQTKKGMMGRKGKDESKRLGNDRMLRDALLRKSSQLAELKGKLKQVLLRSRSFLMQ
jgi:hypothetical protein